MTNSSSRSPKNTPPSLPPLTENELNAALVAAVRESLPPIAGGLGILLAMLAVLAATLMSGKNTPVMAITAGISAVALWGFYLAVRRWELPENWVLPLSAAIAGIAIANNLLLIHFSKEPLQIVFLILAVISAGFVLLSTPWLAVFLTITLVGWMVASTSFLSSTSRGYFGAALALSTLISLVAHQIRREMIQRSEGFRLQDARRKAELETVLKTTDDAQRSLATSMAVGQSIVSVLDLEVLLPRVASLIQERFHCYYVGIFLLDEGDEKYIVLQAGTGEGGQVIKQGVRVEIGQEGIISWVAAHRRPACVSDVSQDSRYIPHEALPETRSEVALPLEVGPNLLGVLDMESTQLGAFAEEDVPFLQLLADQVAIAIQNASLYEFEKLRRRFAENLNSVGRALSTTLNLSEVLNIILNQLGDMVQSDRAAVLLQHGKELDFAAFRGFPVNMQNVHISVREGDVYQEIYRTQKPLHITDVMLRSDWQQVEYLPPARSWLGVPLIRANDVIGMLSLARESVSPYTDDEIALASTFGGQAAIALHNARLYEQISRFNQDLEKLASERTAALQNAYDQLERMDRAKSDFISVASHELRTPITLLRGYSQMLADEAPIKQAPQLLAMANGIQAGATRLHEIVDSMLDVAKIESQELELHPTPIALASMIRYVSDGQREALNERHLILVEELQELPPIEADLDALRKVFYHLMANAIKYTPDGGRITISGRALKPGEMDMTDGGVEIVVSDTGIGIDPNLRDLVFIKFYQTGQVSLHSTGKTKFKGGGPGLGLAIARGVVEAHGGLIWAESPGYDEVTCPGTQFHVVLPLHQKALHGSQAVAS